MSGKTDETEERVGNMGSKQAHKDVKIYIEGNDIQGDESMRQKEHHCASSAVWSECGFFGERTHRSSRCKPSRIK